MNLTIHNSKLRANAIRPYNSKLIPCLLLLLLAACDSQSVTPTAAPPSPSVSPSLVAPTPTIIAPSVAPTATIAGVRGSAQQYAITVDDLLPGYRFVDQQRGEDFYASRYEKDDKFRKFEQTIYLLTSADEAAQRTPRLLDIFTSTLRERTNLPLSEVKEETIGEATYMREYQWGNAGSQRGGVDIAFRYQNVVATVSFSYDAGQMPADDARQRARGLAVIILGKLIAANQHHGGG